MVLVILLVFGDGFGDFAGFRRVVLVILLALGDGFGDFCGGFG